MKKPTKIFHCNVVLLLLILLLAGCTGGSNEKANTDQNAASQPQKNSKIEKKEKTGSMKETEEQATDDTSKTTQKDNNVPTDKDNAGKKEADKVTTKEEAKTDQKNKDNTGTQRDNQDAEIRTDTPEKDQKKAISLVRDYLRNQYDGFIEDKDNFLAYDGEIKGYIIVRYATLLSGHTSTNGRYAVDMDGEKVADVTADPGNPDNYFGY